ncbi:hypothetical protein CBS14141_000031 [Malassezia furfur]|nr:hypothetical protein CBS14141_000031 [Malassezia furfur]
MLASPLRRCIVTHAVLPNALMIQLKAAKIPGDQAEYTILPDAILHPQFAQKKLGRGMWICNDQRVYQRLFERPPDAGILPRLHILLTHQFQERLVQEVELLCEAAQHAREATPCAESAPLNVAAGDVPSLCLTTDAPDAGRARLAIQDSTATYALPRLVPDAELHEQLVHGLDAWARQAPEQCQRTDTGYNVALHASTAALGVACWRASSWLDSGIHTAAT